MLLVTGSNGQLEHCLMDVLQEKNAIFTDVSELDITNISRTAPANPSCKVKPILSKEYLTKANRLKYSVLNKSKIKKEFSITISHWTKGVDECLTKLS